MTKLQTTTGNASPKLFLTTLALLFSALLLGCSEDSGQQEISQKIEQPEIKVISGEIPKISHEVQNTKSISPGTNSSKGIAQELPSKQGVKLLDMKRIEKKKKTDDVIAKNPNDKQESIEEQFNQLQGSLGDKNQENAVLRQHMKTLLRKVQENQNAIEEFEPQNNQQTEK